MKTVFFGIGSNLGNRLLHLVEAYKEIEARIGEIVKFSAVYQTAPWGFDSNLTFFNQVFQVNTHLSADETLEAILSIEEILGRKRNSIGYADRVIDIDILFFADFIINKPDLIVPHPHMHKRRFVLEPLCIIAPNFVHPGFNLTVKKILEQCKDDTRVDLEMSEKKFSKLLQTGV